MSYLVLARKWRPQTFEEVVGQKPITQALQNAIATNRVAHAYLFAGPRGVGKTSVARILAKALNCQQGLTGHPCDHCPSCLEIREGIAVDVLEIDGASNRGIEEIRQLRENVRYLPSKNRYKVYILDEVHMLTDQAFNALLKTLEEPPPHVIFIFATTEPHKIPATILSRCQRYDFKRIPLASVLDQLRKIVAREEVEISDQSLHLIAREAEGSMRDGQSLLDQVLSYAGQKVSDKEVIEVLGVIDRKILHDSIAALADGDQARLLQIVEEIHSFGYDMRDFCGELASLLRDLLVLKVIPQAGSGSSSMIDLPAEETRELALQAEKFSREEIHSLFRALLTAYDEVARSAFPRLVLEMTLTRVARRKPILSIEEALEKLRAMEERLIGEGASPAPLPAGPTLEERISQPEADEEEPKPEAAPRDRKPDIRPQECVPKELPEGSREVWRELVQFAKKKKPPLASILERGVPLSLDRDRLEIGYLENSFYLERMQEPETLSVVKALCSEFFKEPVQVQICGIKSDSPVPRENGEDQDRTRRNSKQERDKEALNHPLVREAINIFGGGLWKLKTPKEKIMTKGFGNIMRQAQQLQAKMLHLQEEMATRTVEASAGGGMVTAVANGKQELVSIKLEKEVVNPEDLEMLQDLILAAANAALKKAQEMVSEEMKKLTGGMNIPGLM